MEKSETSKKMKIKNNAELILFCTLIGAFAGVLVWVLLKIMAVGMEFIWEWIPNKVTIPFYTVIICTIGAGIVGIFRKKYGDYPEELETVLGKIKSEKKYEYKNMFIMMIAALLPLLIGSSIGPEAGLTEIIVGLCYWAGDNLKYARKHTKDCSKIGIAVSLSVLFHAPLFGIFEVEEDKDEYIPDLSKISKIILYILALLAGMGSYMGLSSIFGSGLSGFPRFKLEEISRRDYLLVVIYIICGIILASFYKLIHFVTKILAEKIPPVFREIIAGLSLGIIGMLIPAIMFSGEEQMGILMKEYTKYIPMAMIGVSFLKIVLTNLCIQFGLKGGHFFPLIFSGVCMGYGAALLVNGNSESNLVFAAAIVTASLLGKIMKKPIAVTMLLFLCFPVKLFFWIIFSATFASFFEIRLPLNNREKSNV